VYLAATLLGVVLQRLWPLGLVPPPVGRWIGAVLIAGWVVLAAMAIREFRGAGTTVMPTGEVSAFVTSGPFRFTRNPMYLGLAFLQAGVAFVLSNAWVLALLPLSIAVVDRVVIPGEERYLEAKYGADYAAYRTRVRRWL
jgi:protein-S-isoprenylcysteine O-methyltransferase Ste14